MRNLVIENLSKTYPNNVKALNNVSIKISSGMFGLLGPNGAGKSSLMRTIATLQEADSGSIFFDDLNVLDNSKEFRQQLGYLPQEFGVYPRITAEQLLDHIATLKGISSKKERKDLVDFLLQKVNLYDKKNKSVKGFSGGMKQRIGIAQSLIGNPKVLIVDEPTAGLDPGENRFYDLLSDVGEDVLVILSTHIVGDVRELCTQMAIMNHGEIVFNGSPDEGISSLKGKVFQKHISKSELETYKQNHQVISNKLIAGKPIIHVLNSTIPDKTFKKIESSLEDVFFTKIQNK